MRRLFSLFTLFLFIINCGKTVQHQKLYDISQVPIVDMHTHLTGTEDFEYCVKTMKEWGGVVSVTVNSNPSELMHFIRDSIEGRILLCMRAPHHENFTAEQIVDFKKQNYSGIKMWLQYITSPLTLSHEQADKMEEVGLPFVAMHIANPPEDIWHVPEKFMLYQQQTEKFVQQHPNVNFIMAHGFYLTNSDSDIDTLSMFLDRNPNLYIDICCSKWWDAPQPGYMKLRQFLIGYKDRIMFGTDFNKRRTSAGFIKLRERLETDKKLTFGNNGGQGPGLALPLDVLNRLYYWNAAKVIPGVKEALINLGYEISDSPPKASPVKYGLNYDPLQSTVIDHAETADMIKKFPIVFMMNLLQMCSRIPTSILKQLEMFLNDAMTIILSYPFIREIYITSMKR